MDAASPLGVAPASPAPPPEWPDATRWTAPPSNLSVRLADPPVPAWSRSAQVTAAFFLLLALILLTYHYCAAQRWYCQPSTLESAEAEPPFVELNRADRAQLLQLPGVGENLALRIEAYRTAHRGFRDVEELRRVRGIGPKVLEKIRPFVYVEPPATEEEAEPPPPLRRLEPAAPQAKRPVLVTVKKVSLPQPLDLNRATLEELQRLPGIGPKLSQRILDARARKPFASVDELRRVRGIGPKTLEKLRPHVVVEE